MLIFGRPYEEEKTYKRGTEAFADLQRECTVAEGPSQRTKRDILNELMGK